MRVFNNLKKVETNKVAQYVNAGMRQKGTFSLYLDVLRTCRFFRGQYDENGVEWSTILRYSAREEIESSKEEKDPYILAQALFNGEMALTEIQEQLHAKQKGFKLDEFETERKLVDPYGKPLTLDDIGDDFQKKL